MTRRERLLATLQGKPVDRPAVNFYEVGGFRVNRYDPSPFNIYNSPDWQPLLDLAETESDLIRMVSPIRKRRYESEWRILEHTESWMENGSQYTRTVLTIGRRTLTSLSRRDPEVSTLWTLEHLLKDRADAEAFLSIPAELMTFSLETTPIVQAEAELGDRGLVMVDTADPLCLAASLFSMEDYTIVALTEPSLFHALLERFAARLWPETEEIARRFPGRLWRIYGPEYASEPYLPPSLFEEYVVRYTGPMVKMIQRTGGYARLHCHGRLRHILPAMAAMGIDALDPIEPPPQGDVELIEVREQYGRQMVLFGNIEASDLENLPPPQFEQKARKALREGTAGEGRGFVLMPSAATYGRRISPTTLENYRTLLRVVQSPPTSSG